jgi:hypothetical protein
MADTGRLDEHQAPDTSGSPNSAEMGTDEEQKLVKLVNRLFAKAKRHRSRYDTDWLKYYKFFRGRQWERERPSFRHAEVVNLTFQHIQAYVPQMVDSRPRIEFLAQEPQDFELAEILNEVAESDWERKNWLMELIANLYDGSITGHAMGSMEFDAKGEGGIGSIEMKAEDPFHFYVDPEAQEVNDPRCRYIFKVEPRDVDAMKLKYPDKRHVIRADVLDTEVHDKTHLNIVKYTGPTDDDMIPTDQTGPADESGRDRVTVFTLWIKPNDTVLEEQEEIDQETGDKKIIQQARLKYPNGRKLVMMNNRIIEGLEQEPDSELPAGTNPYEDGKFPYAKLLNYMLPREYYGISEVEQLESPQKTFNKLISFALDVLTLMGNPIWVIDNTSGIDEDNLVNAPGLIVTKNPGTEARRESGVSLQPYVLQMIEMYRDWFNGISGRQDVSEGVKPKGVTAASAITALQEASQTRLRLKSRLMDAYLRDMGQLYLSRVFQFYTAPRVFRLTAKDGTEKYFKFSVEDQPADAQGNIPGQQVKLNPFKRVETEGGDVTFVPDAEKILPIRGEFDVRVSTGSSLPFAKAEKFDLAAGMFDRNAIDREELLDAAEWPNREQVLERMEKAEQAAAQAEAQAQGGAPAAPA